MQHEDDTEEVPIKMWDCDSITQAKEKILDALYRNTPVSKRPQLTAVDLGTSIRLSIYVHCWLYSGNPYCGHHEIRTSCFIRMLLFFQCMISHLKSFSKSALGGGIS